MHIIYFYPIGSIFLEHSSLFPGVSQDCVRQIMNNVVLLSYTFPSLQPLLSSIAGYYMLHLSFYTSSLLVMLQKGTVYVSDLTLL